MWKQIGVDVKIVDSEFSKLRERYRGRSWTGNQAWTQRAAGDPAFWNFDAFFTSPGVGGGVVFAFNDPFIDERWKQFVGSIDPLVRQRALQDIGDFVYNNYATVPLLWLGGLAGIDPKVVAEYKCDTEGSGPAKCHEYTKAVRK